MEGEEEIEGKRGSEKKSEHERVNCTDVTLHARSDYSDQTKAVNNGKVIR